VKQASTLFLRLAILAIAAVVLAICIFPLPALWRAVPGEYPNHAYVFYCILGAFYVAAIPFYVALYQAMRLLGYIDAGKAFSVLSVKALQRIAICALSISAAFAASMPFFYIWAENDDAPGLIVISMFLVLAPFVIAVFAAVLQRLFREAIEIKSENDLTV
jgi:hypothetical protein